MEGPDSGVDGFRTSTGKQDVVPDEVSPGRARSQKYAMGGEQGSNSNLDVEDDIPCDPEEGDQDENIFDIEYTSKGPAKHMGNS